MTQANDVEDARDVDARYATAETGETDEPMPGGAPATSVTDAPTRRRGR